MSLSPARQLAGRVGEQQRLILAVTRDLTAAQAAAAPGPHAPAISFHLWHIARWADIVQAHLPGMGSASVTTTTQEIWEREGLATAWGLGNSDLGYRATGMSLPDHAAQALVLSAKDTLHAYATRTFAAATEAAMAIDDARFVILGRDPLGRESSVGGTVLNHLLHLGRHLGMIEALRGVLGLHGTATR